MGRQETRPSARACPALDLSETRRDTHSPKRQQTMLWSQSEHLFSQVWQLNQTGQPPSLPASPRKPNRQRQPYNEKALHMTAPFQGLLHVLPHPTWESYTLTNEPNSDPDAALPLRDEGAKPRQMKALTGQRQTQPWQGLGRNLKAGCLAPKRRLVA